MKRLIVFAFTLFSVTAYATEAQEPEYGPGFWDSTIDTTLEDAIGGETNIVLPNEETITLRPWFSPMLQFPQTQWNECASIVTGNYIGFDCAQNRGISVILNSYLQQKLITCVDAGLAAVEAGPANVIHVTHAGIAADANHSPRSLHSHKRAIDVKSIAVQFTNGAEKTFDYALFSSRPFYVGLRKCWGKVVHDGNGCPYYQGNPSLTGSIGWENTAHGRHMHLSVPYCVNGSYGSGVWMR